MTNEEKKELLIALCGYYPYGVICNVTDINDPEYSHDGRLIAIKPSPFDCNGLPYLFEVEGCSVLADITELKPYLRPEWTMTTEERRMMDRICDKGNIILLSDSVSVINTLNGHFYDCGGLIRKRLALEAKEGMYKSDNNNQGDALDFEHQAYHLYLKGWSKEKNADYLRQPLNDINNAIKRAYDKEAQTIERREKIKKLQDELRYLSILKV